MVSVGKISSKKSSKGIMFILSYIVAGRFFILGTLTVIIAFMNTVGMFSRGIKVWGQENVFQILDI